MLRTFNKFVMFAGLVLSMNVASADGVDNEVIWQLDGQNWTYTGKTTKKSKLVHTIITTTPNTFKTNTLDLITKELVRLPFVVNQSKNK